MALVAADSAGALVELDNGGPPGTLARLVESQRELFHSQIDQLQKLVVAQCKLTGVNPLAQEMAAGALSIRIGKRPRDLLNPKAAKYMQSVFSIKDAIGKKESREISALCGVTVSQVREYFAGQRSRVRKLVRLSCEKVTRLEESKTSKEDHLVSLDQSLPVSEVPSGNAAASDAFVTVELKQVPDNTGIFGTVKTYQQETLTSIDLVKEEGRPSLLQEETIPGVNSDDKEFLSNIFNLMRKEQTFSSQVKLMEWVLCVENSAVLNWFSNNGGITILATWLSQAAVEEQTTVLLVILKVLYHLPVHKALPVHMSAIVPVVNRLRFYRTSDISNRARVLLSRWSKVFIKSQALKRPFVSSFKTTMEAIHKQRMSGFLNDELLQAKLDIPEDILALTEDAETTKTIEPKQTLKLLPASGADSSKNHDRSVSSTKSKERRKVLLVEQPDHRAAGRSAQVVRAVSANHSRPMSADDIQKAKLRAMFMQHKYGKVDPSSSGSKLEKIEDPKALSASQINNVLSECKAPQDPHLIKEGNSIRIVSTKDNLLSESETASNSNSNSTSKQDCLGMLNCKPIQWKIPRETQISSTWSMGAGEDSKEFDVQTQRNQREKEAFYSCLQDIPPNPKEPWDREMDFDDTLTPEIPTEQPPDADAEEGSSCAPIKDAEEAPASKAAADVTCASPISDGPPEPDLELLAVLLKNPDLVFALTSNQGKSLTSEEMVLLLDMLKRNGVGLTGMLNELAHPTENSSHKTRSQEQEPPTSLPSPTPPSEAARSGWRSDFRAFSKTPVLQPHFSGNRTVAALTSVVLQPPPATVFPVVSGPQTPGLVSPAQAPATISSVPEGMMMNDSTTRNLPPMSLLPTRTPAPSPPPQKTSIRYPLQQTKVFNSDLPSKQYPVTKTTFISSIPLQESLGHSRTTMSCLPALPALPHNLQRPQLLPKAEPSKVSPIPPTWPPVSGATKVVRQDTTAHQLISQPNGILEAAVPNQQYVPIQNNYSTYPSGTVSQAHMLPGSLRGDRNGSLHGDGGSLGSTEFPAGWSYNDESRRESRSNKMPEWSTENWDRYRSGGGGKRWQDHGHGHGHGHGRQR
ncbi:homeobox protein LUMINIDEPENDENS isoform X1 [Musa acuminata AAA Group]|uniref:homeobox protein LUMINIDEPENDENS isoform X1 n=2 Tax=Musa acuminata AAA Group TaxID=214697 RepID=UPI0031CDCEC2